VLSGSMALVGAIIQNLKFGVNGKENAGEEKAETKPISVRAENSGTINFRLMSAPYAGISRIRFQGSPKSGDWDSQLQELPCVRLQ
jgi:hypothetical protein